jgi:hypothetical protein
MSEKKIERTLDAASMMTLLPQDGRLKIVHLCIGVEVHHFTYTTAVSGSPGGHISGGGTSGGSYRTYDFGFDAENLSDKTMRVSFTIAKVTEDGFTQDKSYAWEDVSPHEKRRVWAGLRLDGAPEFKSQMVSEVNVGPTPPEGRNGLMTPTETTSPNKSLYDIFGLEKAPLKSLRVDRQQLILALGILGCVCLGPFAAIPALIIAAISRRLATKAKVGVGLAVFSLLIQALVLVFWKQLNGR